MPPRTATHAVMLRLGAPHRVAPLTDAQAMLDFRVAASLPIGIYSLREVDSAEAARLECVVAGMMDAYKTMAGPEWRRTA